MKANKVANNSQKYKGIGVTGISDVKKDFAALSPIPESLLVKNTANVATPNYEDKIGSNAFKAQKGDHGQSLSDAVADGLNSVGETVKEGLGVAAGGKVDQDRGNIGYTPPQNSPDVQAAVDRFNKK